jgi:hypothetical protein
LSYLPQALLHMASLEAPNQDMAEPAAEEDDGQSSSCSSEEEWWLQEAEDPAARNMVFLLTFSALLCIRHHKHALKKKIQRIRVREH